MAKARVPSSRAFADAWSKLEPAERLRLRRAVRRGRALDTPEAAALAVAHVRRVRAGWGWRLHPLWMGLILVALLVGARLGAWLLVGAVAASAFLYAQRRRNVARAEALNGALVEGRRP